MFTVLTQRFHVPGLRRGVFVALLAALTVCIAACGGGGGSGGGGPNDNTSSLPPVPTAMPIAANTDVNTVGVRVDAGVDGWPNIPTVSVTICVPDAVPANCQTVDHVLVDTMSIGLRISNSVLPSTFTNALLTTATPGSSTLAECYPFAASYTWGTVRKAVVTIGSETTASIPIQITGDLPNNAAPSACAGSLLATNTPSELGVNGILGIGVAPIDCGTDCAAGSSSAGGDLYYSCPSSGSCTGYATATAQQVANPVPNFVAINGASDTNGIILEMPSLSYSGASIATGTLVFGIGTRLDNAMNATYSFQTDSTGRLPGSTFNSRSADAFLDSGSNGLFFTDGAMPVCGGWLTGFYCPSSPQPFSATLLSQDGSSASVDFGVVSAATLMGATTSNGNYAFNALGGQVGSNNDLDLGLPFFYGRYVYFRYPAGSQPPYVAF